MKKSQAKKYIKEQVKSFVNEKSLKPLPPEDEDIDTKDNYEGEASVEDIQADLQAAFNKAQGLGDPKLSQQIANTISYFTKSHVLGKQAGAAGAGMMEINRLQELAGLKEYGLEHDPTQVDDEDFEHPSLKRDKKKEVKEEESQPSCDITFYSIDPVRRSSNNFKRELESALSDIVQGDLSGAEWIQNNVDHVE